jgi:hypothetical protein
MSDHRRRRSLDEPVIRLWEAASWPDRLTVTEPPEPKEHEMMARAIPKPHTTVAASPPDLRQVTLRRA